MTVQSDLRTCDECGDVVDTLFSLGRAERCYDCHMDARSWDVDPAYAGETYWGDY